MLGHFHFFVAVSWKFTGAKLVAPRTAAAFAVPVIVTFGVPESLTSTLNPSVSVP